MNRLFRRFAGGAVLVSGIALSGFVAADDGQIEINQFCVPTGCFDGDPNGFPIEIYNPGSYVLTSDLVVPEGGIGIRLYADDIEIDLNGHTLAGPVQCSGDNPDCSPTSSGFGITGTVQDVVIANGAVKGFGQSCIAIAGDGLLLRDLFISNCGGPGINSSSSGIIESVVVHNNGGTGGFLEPAIIVRDSVFRNNGGRGIWRGICRGNLLQSNGDAAGTVEEQCDSDDGSNICGTSSCP